MERILVEGGVEPENRARARAIVELLYRVAGCRSFEISNVAESPDLTLTLCEARSGIAARAVFGALASECRGVRDATVIFPRSGVDAPLEIRVAVLKEGRRGVARHVPGPPPEIYLIERLRRAADGGLRMPRALEVALKGVARDVIGYCRPKLEVRVDHSPDARSCVATFAGARECSAAFLEYLFDRHGRRLTDVAFRSEGLERALVATLDLDRELPRFPRRAEEGGDGGAEDRKRTRLE